MELWSNATNLKTKKFDEFGTPVTGLDYNPLNGHIYAAFLQERTLMYYVPNRVPDNTNFTKTSVTLEDRTTAVKFAFGALWLGVGKVLKKCFPEKIISAGVNNACSDFHVRAKDNNVNFIGASTENLCLNFENVNFMWCCDPKKPMSCTMIIFPLENMGTFVLVK